MVAALLGDCDAIVHLAAISSVPACEASPLESYRTNVLGTCLLLEQALAARPDIRFLFASSAAVYGLDSGPMNDETKGGLRPQSFYAAQKFAGEQMLRQFADRRGLKALAFRFFNVYGPGQDPRSQYSGVISRFGEAIRKNEPLRLFAGGTQTRDFVSVRDVVGALCAALDLPLDRYDPAPINLGSGRSVSVRELASLMLRLSGRSLPIEEAPPRPGDIQDSGAMLGRAKSVLNWEAAVALETGLAELL